MCVCVCSGMGREEGRELCNVINQCSFSESFNWYLGIIPLPSPHHSLSPTFWFGLLFIRPCDLQRAEPCTVYRGIQHITNMTILSIFVVIIIIIIIPLQTISCSFRTYIPWLPNTYIKYGRKNGMELSQYRISFMRFYQSFQTYCYHFVWQGKKTQL